MEKFINVESEGNKVEMLIDTNVFPKEIAMKATYSFLDRGYFFFKLVDGNLLVQCESKEENFDSEKMVKEYSDELLAFLLRDNLEKENKTVRDTIITTALNSAYDPNGFANREVDEMILDGEQIDFDKDIDDIISEIENDPDLQFDDDEISSIISEIENESEIEKPKIVLDPNSLKDAKKVFQDK
jgi:His-Xaa-Ser system protein HxsD